MRLSRDNIHQELGLTFGDNVWEIIEQCLELQVTKTGGDRMTDQQVQCEICGFRCTSRDALTHLKLMGHNLWTLILPEEED